jgi:hypothetical protein
MLSRPILLGSELSKTEMLSTYGTVAAVETGRITATSFLVVPLATGGDAVIVRWERSTFAQARLRRILMVKRSLGTPIEFAFVNIDRTSDTWMADIAIDH